jgi:hypothetical protein
MLIPGRSRRIWFKVVSNARHCGNHYGGTYIDEDFRDRNVADQWFEQRYNKKMAAKDMEATAKYRFERILRLAALLASISRP